VNLLALVPREIETDEEKAHHAGHRSRHTQDRHGREIGPDGEHPARLGEIGQPGEAEVGREEAHGADAGFDGRREDPEIEKIAQKMDPARVEEGRGDRREDRRVAGLERQTVELGLEPGDEAKEKKDPRIEGGDRERPPGRPADAGLGADRYVEEIVHA